MRQNQGTLLPLVAGLVIVAVLATLVVEGGWVRWLPAGLALAVLARLRYTGSP
jgi:hypothetical protein